MRVTTTSGGADRPFVVFLIALLVGSVFVVPRLESYDWNPTGFVHAGGRFVDAGEAPPDLLVRHGEVGFDGTGFYRFALNPATRDRFERGIELDLPAFRHQRILYPLIVWAASGGGRATAVGWALIAVNLLAFAGVGWLGGSLARAAGRHALWGLVFPFYPGFAVSLGLDTAEIVAAFFALFGVLFVVRRQAVPAMLAFTAAMFTRETTLLIGMGIALAWLLAQRSGRWRDTKAIPIFVVPGLAYAAWQVVLHSWWDEWALATGSSVDVSPPLTGLVQAAQDWPRTDGTQAAYQFILVAAIAAFVVTAIVAARRARPPAFAVIAFGAGASLALLFSDAIWLHHWGFLRAFTETYLMGAFMILWAGIGLRRVAVASGALWVSIALNLVLHP